MTVRFYYMDGTIAKELFSMRIELQRISTNFCGKTCLVHARGAKSPNGILRITMQPLRLTGMDVFYGMQMLESQDGKSWLEIRPCVNLLRHPAENGMERVLCDATPLYHKKTGTWLEIGVGTYYLNDELAPGAPRCTLWTVYEEHEKEWLPPQKLEIPGREEHYRRSGCGCGQCVELDNGDLLIPITYNTGEDLCSKAVIFRCAFDGRQLRFLEDGTPMTSPIPRGLYEPSVMDYNGAYYLCLRNDETGYVARSDDGLRYDRPLPLCFEDGSNVGNYNTQQHWIRGGGRLYLVYTRRGVGNDHVFRHRAPLLIAEFDTQRMCLLRETEQVVVPERGARLGNFGCAWVSEKESYVFASEWMQPIGCEKYGSDNSVFVARLHF